VLVELACPRANAQLQQMERMAPYAVYFAAVSQIIFLPLVALAITGIAIAIFVYFSSGRAS